MIYRLKKEKDFVRSFEYAGASQTIRVSPGDYPVEQDKDLTYRFFVKMPGTLVHDFFMNRIGAACSVSESKPMTPVTYSLHLYSFQVEELKKQGVII